MRKIENISCNTFYGGYVSDNAGESIAKPILPLYHSRKLRRIQGPLLTWKIFKKQEDCLKFVSGNNGLLAFTFENVNNVRTFLAADPSIFWYYYFQREKDKHSYEIIQEYCPCKLYFDLEFDRHQNKYVDGNRMVNCFITLVCYALKVQYGLICDRSHVLDLDSTYEAKFSRHLVFQMKEVIFCNNYDAGSFVKQLCFEINSIIENNSTSLSGLCLLKNLNTVPLNDIKMLQIYNKRGVKVLFCDQAVYSKNRHFRLYSSSKLNKNIPLILSEQNEFYPNTSKDDSTFEENLFLSSLITYISQLDDKSYLSFQSDKIDRTLHTVRRNNSYHCNRSSPFKDIDNFIASIIQPGQIWRTAYFPDKGIITYDIVNNRFCGNIGREHRSNNVKYVVNVFDLCYYQKCYDPDCAHYKSQKRKLPLNLTFLLNDDVFTEKGNHDYDYIDDGRCISFYNNGDSLFPDYGLSDEEFMNISY